MRTVSVEVLLPATIGVQVECECGKCKRHLVKRGVWRKMTAAVRTQLAGKGFSELNARGLCSRCYQSLSPDERLDYSRKTLTDEEFAEEYDLLRERGVTAHEVRTTLGMTVAAFERALSRARKRGAL